MLRAAMHGTLQKRKSAKVLVVRHANRAASKWSTNRCRCCPHLWTHQKGHCPLLHYRRVKAGRARANQELGPSTGSINQALARRMSLYQNATQRISNAVATPSSTTGLSVRPAGPPWAALGCSASTSRSMPCIIRGGSAQATWLHQLRESSSPALQEGETCRGPCYCGVCTSLLQRLLV